MVSNDDATAKESDYVQEIVRKDPSLIPERYIRSEEDRAKDVELSAHTSEIPILDLTLLSNEHREELEKLDKACKEWGLFQVINHGITLGVQQIMKNAAAGFFKLPIHEKTKYSYDPDALQGYGQPYAVSEDQRVDWSDSLILRLYPSQSRTLQLWPTTPPEFKDALEAYSAGVIEVTERLLDSLSLIMGMERDALLGLHKEISVSMRMNYYPLCCRPDQVLGLAPHSDATSITILMQDDDITGLQIRHDGGWVPVKPIPNSLVVNIGDAVEIWSNGKYRSVEHRAVTSKTRERISFASFVMPHMDAEIEPLEQTQEGHRMYKKIKYGDYLKHCLQRKMKGKAHTEYAKYSS